MTKSDYDALQSICDAKMHEGNKRFPASPNRADGWKEAFLMMKSLLHGYYNSKRNMEEKRGE